MSKITVPKNEQGRIAALKLYEILDTVPEQEFDNLAQLAAEICNTPIALISLVDESRQWIKARVGIETQEIPRDYSFCNYTILDDEIFEVSNPLADSRFDKNPFVTGSAGIRFYAGVPLINKDGFRLGALCVMTPKHHQLNSYQRISIQILASAIMSLMELRRERKEAELYRTAIDETASVSLLDAGLNVLYANEWFCKMVGLKEVELIGKNNNEIKLADISTDQANSIFESIADRKIWKGRVKNQNIKGTVTWSDLTVIPFGNKENEASKILFIRNDVTDQVLLRERLEEAEILAKTGCWELNIFSRNTYWSPGMFALLDYDTVEERQSEQSIMNFIAPVDFDRVNEANKKLLEKKSSFDRLEFKILTTKGREKDISAVVRKRFNSKGGLTGIYGTLHDVTETRHAEQAVREKEEQIFDLYNNAPCGYYSTDANGHITDINNAMLRWLGYSKDELLSVIKPEDLLQHASHKSYADAVHALGKSGYFRDLGVTFLAKDGAPVHVLANAQAVHNKKGHLLHYNFNIKDVTEIRNLKDQLEETEAASKNQVQGSDQLLLLMDTDCRFTDVSEKLQMLTGFSANLVMSQAFLFAWDEEWRNKAISYYKKQLSKAETETVFLLPIKDSEGEKLWMEITGTLVNDDDVVTGVKCFLYDVTEKVKTEEALHEVAWIAMEAKDMQMNIVEKMSQDVRMPMNGVVGMVNLLSTTHLSAEQKVLVGGIKDATSDMLRKMDDLLEEAKNPPVKHVVKDTEFELKQLVNHVIFTLKPGADEKNIRLILQIDNKIPLSVIADKGALNKILTNIAGNAIKFTEKGSVSISVLQKAVVKDVITLEFIIKDTGIGIPENKIDSIFESFNQPGRQSPRVAGGAGLGLTLAKQLVEQQNGEIKVKSQEGIGTTFSFTYTCRQNKQPLPADRPREVTEENVSLAGYNILLVEDNLMSQRIGRATLENWGATVALADLGQKAIDLVRSHKYDVILMDLQMPEMSGIEATTILRQELGDTTPIMGMTVSEMQASREMCLKAGMNEYILKPLKPVELHQKIFALLKKPELKLVEKVINTDYVKEKITNINFARNITGNDLPLIKEILEMYISKTPSLLEELELHIATRNYKLAQAGAHYLKNSVGLLGADTLFHMLASIEYQLNNVPPSSDTLDLLDKMKMIVMESIEETIEELRAL